MRTTASSWTYVLITPDGLVTQALPGLLGTFRSAGLQPVAARLIRVDAATMLGIYDTPTRTRPVALPPKRAFDLWYSLGPGCVVLLFRDGPGASAAMLEVKGATDPRAARSGTIRYGGENALMNLVHCPDDEAEAVEELHQLLGDQGAAELERLGGAPSDEVRLLTVDSMVDAVPVHGGGEVLSVPLIVNRIRLRVVQNLAIQGSGSGPVRPALMEILAALREERNEIRRMPTSPGRAGVAHAHSGPIHDRLVDAAERLEAPTVRRALLGLAASVTGVPDDWSGTRAALDGSGTYLSGTESAVLELDRYV